MVFWRANNHAASRENVRRPLATSAVNPTSSTTGSSNAKTSCITECLRSQRFQDGANGHPVASTALMCSWNRVSPHRHSRLHWAALVDAKPDSTRHGRWQQQLRHHRPIASCFDPPLWMSPRAIRGCPSSGCQASSDWQEHLSDEFAPWDTDRPLLLKNGDVGQRRSH